MKKLIFAACMLLASGFASAAVESKAVVVQATGDKVQFERAFKLASNMHEVLSKAKFEIVVFGPAVKMLKEDSDEVPLIQKVQGEGIKVIACGRSMETDNVKASELAADIRTTPFGAVHIVNRQQQGWQYFRP